MYPRNPTTIARFCTGAITACEFLDESLSNVIGLTLRYLCSCEGIVLWRGHFNSNGSERRLNMVLNGGAGEYVFLSIWGFILTLDLGVV